MSLALLLLHWSPHITLNRWETSSGGKRRSRKKAKGGKRRHVMSTGRALTHAQVSPWKIGGRRASWEVWVLVHLCVQTKEGDRKEASTGQSIWVTYEQRREMGEGRQEGEKFTRTAKQSARREEERPYGIASGDESWADWSRKRWLRAHLVQWATVITRRIHSTCFNPKANSTKHRSYFIHILKRRHRCFIATASFSSDSCPLCVHLPFLILWLFYRFSLVCI